MTNNINIGENMRRNPIYTFKDLTQTGIDQVPIESIIQINDSDGNGMPRTVQLIDKHYPNVQPWNGRPFDATTTIADFLKVETAYIDQIEITEIPSELEKITEGPTSAPHTGWRLLGENSDKHATIGIKAIDLTSVSGVVSGPSTYGASGNYSFATGLNTHAIGAVSATFGEETIAANNYSFAIGKYNLGVNPDNVFEIGWGMTGARKNIVEVTNTGLIKTPFVEIQDIDDATDKTLVTREYARAGIDSKYDKTGGDITGEVRIIGQIGTPGNLYMTGDLDCVGNGYFNKKVQAGKPNNSSYISFEFKDIDYSDEERPQLIWDTATKQFYFIFPGINQPQKIWYERNQGTGSGLDADKLQGIDGADYATKVYVDDHLIAGLNLKYDKAGGPVTGNMNVIGLFTAESGAELRGSIDLQHISSSLNVDGLLACDNTILSQGDITTNSKINIGVFHSNGLHYDGASVIEFSDTSPVNFTPRLYWNNRKSEFSVDSTEGTELNIWHAGNFDPTTKMDVGNSAADNLTVNNHLDVNGTASIPYITSSLDVDGDVQMRRDLDVFGKITVGVNGTDNSYINFWDSSNNSAAPKIYWNSGAHKFMFDTDGQSGLSFWHTGNFDPASKLNISGGSITNNLNIGQDLQVNGNVQLLGNIQCGIITNPTLVIQNDLTAGGTITGNKIKIDQTTNQISLLEFNDPDENDQPGIYWDKDAALGNGKFYVNTPQMASMELYHEGNPPPVSGGDIGSYNDLTVNDYFTSKGTTVIEKYAHFLLDTGMGKSGFEFEGIDPVDSSVKKPAIYWESGSKEIQVDDTYWTIDDAGNRNYVGFGTGFTLYHSGNLDQSIFFRKSGGRIGGDVIIELDINGNGGNLTVEGDLIVNGDMSASSRDLTVKDDFYMTADTVDTALMDINPAVVVQMFSNDITLGQNGGSLKIDASDVDFSNLPTTDPGIPGRLWNDAGTLKISL